MKSKSLIGPTLLAFAAALPAPQPRDHDAFHHPRSRWPTAGERHRKRVKAKRRMRNAMAKASRRRNRNAK